jgi:hypothetical protein
MKPSVFLLSSLLFAGCAASLHADDQLQTLRGSCSIAPTDDARRVEFKLQRGPCDDGKHDCNTNNDQMLINNFTGFTIADLKRDGSHLDAVIAAEAGKLTCSGTVHDLVLSGDYTFVPDPAFIARMHQMGFHDFDSEKLQAYTLFHIDTSWIQSLQAAGVSGIDSDNLIALRIFKVDAPFVQSMDSLGFPKLPADKLIAFKVHGVNVEEVKQYRPLGYQPTADELIQMRIFKITPDFIQRMQAKKLNDLTISKLVQIRIFKLAE